MSTAGDSTRRWLRGGYEKRNRGYDLFPLKTASRQVWAQKSGRSVSTNGKNGVIALTIDWLRAGYDVVTLKVRLATLISEPE